MSNSLITAERLRELLHYDLTTGIFTWRKTTSNRVKAGAVAGVIQKRGYIFIGLDGERHLAHRLAWLHVTGSWPESDVDHADRVRTNNAWSNLRLATNAENQHNSGRRRNNTSGIPGVNWDARRSCWVAKICRDRKQHYLGSFDSLQAAADAYARAKRALHPFFNAEVETPSQAVQVSRPSA